MNESRYVFLELRTKRKVSQRKHHGERKKERKKERNVKGWWWCLFVAKSARSVLRVERRHETQSVLSLNKDIIFLKP